MFFFNGSKYDNAILLKALCDNFKDSITLNCIGESCEKFKMINFKFKGLKYNLKLLEICNFIKGNLSELSTNLSNKDKIITKQHFSDHFELLKEKACFPYEWLNEKIFIMKIYHLLNIFIVF